MTLSVFIPLSKADITKREVWGVASVVQPDKFWKILKRWRGLSPCTFVGVRWVDRWRWMTCSIPPPGWSMACLPWNGWVRKWINQGNDYHPTHEQTKNIAGATKKEYAAIKRSTVNENEDGHRKKQKIPTVMATSPNRTALTPNLIQLAFLGETNVGFWFELNTGILTSINIIRSFYSQGFHDNRQTNSWDFDSNGNETRCGQ